MVAAVGFVTAGQQKSHREGADVHGDQGIDLDGGAFGAKREVHQRDAKVAAVSEHGSQCERLLGGQCHPRESGDRESERSAEENHRKCRRDDLEGFTPGHRCAHQSHKNEAGDQKVEVDLHEGLQAQIEATVEDPAHADHSKDW